MTINFSIDPYFDDFDSSKNFKKILFKPSFPVQARELTQLQSILQDQIKKFGNHVFKHGSVVIPGNSFTDLNVPYVKLNYNQTIDINNLENKTLVAASGLTANIRKVLVINNILVALIGYTSGSATGENTFSANEVLSVPGTGQQLTVIASDPSRFASMAFLNAGVFYIRGHFVETPQQSIMMSDLDTTPNCRIVLHIIEDIVTAEDDLTLLDPANGVSNFTAPGADRHRIKLILKSIPLNQELTDDYVELMQYKDGILQLHKKHSEYSELEKNLARRTFDESGDYVVNGLGVFVREHLQSTINNGVYLPPVGDRNKLVVEVESGKYYIRGFEVEKTSQTHINIDKGRTLDHIKDRNSVTMQPRFGQYLFVSNLRSLPQFNTLTTVTLWDSANTADINAQQIGTARVIAIDHQEGDAASQFGIFRLYFIDLILTTGNINSIAGVRFPGGSMTVVQRLVLSNISNINFSQNEIVNSGNRTATVVRFDRVTSSLFVFRHNRTESIPQRGDNVTGVTTGATGSVVSLETNVSNEHSASILRLPVDNIHSVVNEEGVPNISYKTYRELIIQTDGTGAGSTVISGAVIDPIEAGNTLAVSPSSILPHSMIRLDSSGRVISIVGGPPGTQIRLIVSLTKTNVPARIKTLTSRTITVSNPGTNINLGRADIFRLVSVRDSTGDITNRYRLDNGQRDYFYDIGTIHLISNVNPQGAITITFEFFEHSAGGDFFTIDSYRQTLPDITEIRSYTSKTNNITYDLKNSIDFRPRIGDTGNFQHSTARIIDLVQIGSRVETSVKFYVPRIDSVYINKDGTVNIVRGMPSEIPVQPQIPDKTMLLSTLFIPAFTPNIRHVRVTRARNQVYRMSDISRIEDRVHNLEQFTLLSASESNMINYEVLDSETGFARFKSGYLVETFADPGVLADTENPDFSVTFRNGILPRTEVTNTNLTIDVGSSSGFVSTGNVVTLPYREVIFASQTLSTRVTNINPFAVFSWVGNMTLTPRTDNWVDTEVLPTINENITNTEVVTVIRPWVAPPPPPPAPPPAVVIPQPSPPPPPPAPVVIAQPPEVPPVPNRRRSVVSPAPVVVAPPPSPPLPPPVADPCGGDGGGSHGGGGDVGGGVSGVGTGAW